MAVDKLPNFLAAPNSADGKPGPHHQCSIHLNCESVEVLEEAYMEGQQGRPSSRLAKPAVLLIMEQLIFAHYTHMKASGYLDLQVLTRVSQSAHLLLWVGVYGDGFPYIAPNHSNLHYIPIHLLVFLFRPMIEMTIPSVLDPTLAPPGCHVLSLFIQFTPYLMEGRHAWTDEDRERFADTGT